MMNAVLGWLVATANDSQTSASVFQVRSKSFQKRSKYDSLSVALSTIRLIVLAESLVVCLHY